MTQASDNLCSRQGVKVWFRMLCGRHYLKTFCYDWQWSLLSFVSLHTVKCCLSILLYLQGSTDQVLLTILTAHDSCHVLPSAAASSTSCPLSPICHLHNRAGPATSANLHTSESSSQSCLSPTWSCSVITWLLTACPTCLACQSWKIHGHYPETKGQISAHAGPHMLHYDAFGEQLHMCCIAHRHGHWKSDNIHIQKLFSWRICSETLSAAPVFRASVYSKMKKSLLLCEDLPMAAGIICDSPLMPGGIWNQCSWIVSEAGSTLAGSLILLIQKDECCRCANINPHA